MSSSPCQNAPASRQNMRRKSFLVNYKHTACTKRVGCPPRARPSHETLRHFILQQQTRLCRMCLSGNGMRTRPGIVIWYKHPISVSALDCFICLDWGTRPAKQRHHTVATAGFFAVDMRPRHADQTSCEAKRINDSKQQKVGTEVAFLVVFLLYAGECVAWHNTRHTCIS